MSIQSKDIGKLFLSREWTSDSKTLLFKSSLTSGCVGSGSRKEKCSSRTFYKYKLDSNEWCQNTEGSVQQEINRQQPLNLLQCCYRSPGEKVKFYDM